MFYLEFWLVPYPSLELHLLPFPDMIAFWLNVLPAAVAILIAIWAVRRSEEDEKREAAAQAEKDELEGEAERRKPPFATSDGYESNLAQLLAAEDERERLSKLPKPKPPLTLRELLEEAERKRQGQDKGSANKTPVTTKLSSNEKPSDATESPKDIHSANIAEKRGKNTPSKRNASTPRSGRHNMKRGIDEVTEHQDGESDTSSRRVSKRLPKRNRRDDSDGEAAEISMRTTIPGGMEDIEVIVTTPEGIKAGRPKRRAEDLDEESNEDETDAGHKCRTRGRAVRRRRDKSVSEEDQEMEEVHGSNRRRSTRARPNAQSRDMETTDTEQSGTDKGPPRGLRATPFGETSTDEQDSEEDDKSDEADNILQTPRRRGKMPANGSRKKGTRTATSAKKAQAAAAAAKKHSKVATPARVRGETWTERNGRKFKISAKDGKRRELVAVKEWRHKYNMPADSVHPDKYVMHRVIVEKWVTPAELQELERCKLLGWQSDEEEPDKVDHAQMHCVGEKKENSAVELTQLNNSLYNYQPPQYVTSPATQAALSTSLGDSSSRKSKLVSPATLRPPTTLRAHRREPALRSTNTTGRQDSDPNTISTASHLGLTWNSNTSSAVKTLRSSRNSLSDVNMSES